MEECCDLMANIFLQDGGEYSWDWNLNQGKGYTVSGVYHMLSTVDIYDPI